MSRIKPGKITIEFEPVGRRILIEKGKTLLMAAQDAGVGLVALCGGEGWCGTCRVRVVQGKANSITQFEEDVLTLEDLETGYRLACQTRPKTDMLVYIPSESLSTSQRLQIEGEEVEIPLSPAVQFVDLELIPPGLDDLRADADRVKDALAHSGHPIVSIVLPLLSHLSDVLRENKWYSRFVIRNEELISVLPSDSVVYGVAVDVGTTKIAFYLINLITGETVIKTGEMNPQISYGEDVISRITYTMQNKEGRYVLQNILLKTLNEIIDKVIKRFDIAPSQIVEAVFVGNTVIHHLLLNLPVQQLAFSPYVSAINHALDVQAKDIGLNIAQGGYIHLLPNIAGFVGADHSAVILSSELWKKEKTVLVIDIGTNTELSLVTHGQLLSCSCASGPAFEGGHIKEGMRAAPGAIERAQIIDGKLKISTIDDTPPVGICGSGILDAVAMMKSNGIIDEKGAFFENNPNVRRNRNGHLEFVMVPSSETGHGRDITVSQKDVSEIQLAKAAIRTGQEILMAEAGVTKDDIEEVIIAGAFGTYIDVRNAIQIRMLLDIPLNRFRQVGNAAGMGAIQALLSVEKRRAIQRVIKDIRYVELTTYDDFQEKFIEAMYF